MKRNYLYKHAKYDVTLKNFQDEFLRNMIFNLYKNVSKKYNVEMPIVDSVYNILFNKLTPEEAVFKLMTREAKQED